MARNTLGVIGRKLGMTQIYDEAGLCIPVTVVAVEEATVTQVKTTEELSRMDLPSGVDIEVKL